MQQLLNLTTLIRGSFKIPAPLTELCIRRRDNLNNKINNKKVAA